ncbi:MAG: DegV family protein [Anaerolineales bacterium]
MSSRIAILTDSTCDIPQHLIDEYRIGVIPTLIIWGEETYQDRIDLTPQEFYRRLNEDPTLPTTTQPTPATFKTYYREAMEDGAEKIILFTVSSALSGTFNVAKQVASEIDHPIRVIDSKGPTMSLGWQVLAAARTRDAGGDEEEILAAADQVRQNLVQIVLLDTLEYLHKGGRIGSAAKFLGSLLNLKPLVKINHQEGVVEAAGRARTRKGGVKMLLDQFFKHLDPAQPTRIAVLHGDAEEQARDIARRIEEEYQPKELLFNITGPVLGINTGPGAIALCGYPETP